MALIICPECGKEISDQASTCPHCGYPLTTHADPETERAQGSVTNQTQQTDGDLGSSSPQKVEVVGFSSPKAKRAKTILAIVGVIVVLATIVALGTNSILRTRRAQEHAEQVQIYTDNLRTVTYLMLDGAAEAEDAGNLIKNVWHNSIYKEWDSTTDPYTRRNNGNGAFYTDFNDALSALYSDSNFAADIAAIEGNQSDVSRLMKNLVDPPEECSAAYGTLKDYHAAYLDLTNLVTNPRGSLQSFSSSFNAADSDLAKRYQQMMIHLQ